MIVKKNWKPNSKLENTGKPGKTLEPKVRCFKVCENRKTEPKIVQIRKTKNINAPLLRWPGIPSLRILYTLSKSGSNIAASTSGWHWKELNDKLILSRWFVIIKICDSFHDLFISRWLSNIEVLVSFLANSRLLRELLVKYIPKVFSPSLLVFLVSSKKCTSFVAELDSYTLCWSPQSCFVIL